MPCRLRVGFRAKWPATGFLAAGVARNRIGNQTHIRTARPRRTPTTTRRSAVFVIGVDPHKGSHTAAALSSTEEVIAELRVDADTNQRSPVLSRST
jgi:hypothetical protein